MIASSLKTAMAADEVSPRCSACGSGSTRLHLERSELEGKSLFACEDCGSRFFVASDRMPGRREIEASALAAIPAEEEPFRPSKHWIKQVDWLTQLLGYRPKSVLDLACRQGDFLLHWPWNARTEGIEPNPLLAAEAMSRGIKVQVCAPEHASIDKQFDIVCAYDLLNSVTLPGKIFDFLSEAVAPGGLVAIRLRTFECRKAYMAEKRGRAWSMYDSGKRTTFFSRQFLQNKFDSLGFDRTAERWQSGTDKASGESGLITRAKATAAKLIEESPLGRVPLLDNYCVVFQKR